MKLLLALVLIISLISVCYSQSTSSSEECGPYCSGPNCSVCVPYLSNYNAAGPSGGPVYFLGDLGSDTSGLTLKIGGYDCSITWITNGRVDCSFYHELNLYEFYDVEVSNSNGVIILQEDFYSPYISDCGNGYYFMGRCECIANYEGQLCNIEKPPYITSITTSSIDGGIVIANGWFGSTPQNFLFKIGSSQLRIQDIFNNQFVGFAPQGSGTQDVTIYDKSTNQLLFTGSNLFTYDANKCFNDCNHNGECNNGVCTCYYPFVGDYCSHQKDSSCQCVYN